MKSGAGPRLHTLARSLRRLLRPQLTATLAAGAARVLAGTVLVGTVLVGTACHDRAPPLPAQPNVIMIVMDTVRAGRCSLFGYGRDTTPRLAEIARDGTTYTNAWTSASWTIPAHGTLFTGTHQDRHGCGVNGSMRFETKSVTLAELLRDAGYGTGCFRRMRSSRRSAG